MNNTATKSVTRKATSSTILQIKPDVFLMYTFVGANDRASMITFQIPLQGMWDLAIQEWRKTL